MRLSRDLKKQVDRHSKQKHVFKLKLRGMSSDSNEINSRPYLSVVSSSPRVACNSLEISANKTGLGNLRQAIDNALTSDREQSVIMVLADGSPLIIYIERDDDPFRWKLRRYSLSSWNARSQTQA